MEQKETVTALLQRRSPLTGKEKLHALVRLSLPAILAQLTSIMMQYIDAAMVGALGANASAAIGVVSTSTWLLSGLCTACASGFSVQVAQRIGAGDEAGARSVVKHGCITALLFAFILAFTGGVISPFLPGWLGADRILHADASGYFLIYVCALPFLQMSLLGSYLLQCSGNMKVPSILNASMCGFDVIFNLIFIHFFGVIGAAIGTALAQAVVAAMMLYAALVRSPQLHLRKGEPFSFDPGIVQGMLRISLPMALEHAALCGAQIASTRIIAPLGTISIAANSFAVTAESLCYMPGYGIGNAATTLVGQSVGRAWHRCDERHGHRDVHGLSLGVRAADARPSGARAGSGSLADRIVCGAVICRKHRCLRRIARRARHPDPQPAEPGEHLGRAHPAVIVARRPDGSGWRLGRHGDRALCARHIAIDPPAARKMA